MFAKFSCLALLIFALLRVGESSDKKSAAEAKKKVESWLTKIVQRIRNFFRALIDKLKNLVSRGKKGEETKKKAESWLTKIVQKIRNFFRALADKFKNLASRAKKGIDDNNSKNGHKDSDGKDKPRRRRLEVGVDL